MPDVEIYVDQKHLDNLERLFGDAPKDLRRILANAVNRASRTMRTQIIRKAAKALKIKQKIIRSRVWFRKATPGYLASRVRGGVVGFRLIDLGARELKGGGVKVRGQKYPQAFIATMPRTGHRGVFMRKNIMLRLGMIFMYDWAGARITHVRSYRGEESGGELPITEIRSRSITRAIREIAALPEILAIGRATLDKRVLAETKRMLKRRGRAEWLTPLSSK